MTASVLLEAGKAPFTALQTLESGRRIIANLIMDVRWDLSKLGYRIHTFSAWDTHRIMRYLITGSIHVLKSLNAKVNIRSPIHWALLSPLNALRTA